MGAHPRASGVEGRDLLGACLRYAELCAGSFSWCFFFCCAMAYYYYICLMLYKRQVAELLNVSQRTVERCVREGRIPPPVRGEILQKKGGKRTEDRAMWDADAVLSAWGRKNG